MRKYLIGFIAISAILLSGCNFGESTSEQLSDVLSEMNNSEKEYRAVQEKLKDLELAEQTSFNEMMELTKEQEEELNSKLSEVEKSLEERSKYIDEEEASIKKAIESVESFDAVIEKADEDTKSEIESLKNAINDRYDFHSNFITEYKKLTELQKDLYTMIGDEEIEFSLLQDQVTEVNEQNEVVKATIEKFNEATIKVNKLKEDVFNQLEKAEK